MTRLARCLVGVSTRVAGDDPAGPVCVEVVANVCCQMLLQFTKSGTDVLLPTANESGVGPHMAAPSPSGGENC